jgi:hypothetical protein
MDCPVLFSLLSSSRIERDFSETVLSRTRGPSMVFEHRRDFGESWNPFARIHRIDAWFRGQVYASLHNRRLNFVIVSEDRKHARFENSDL